MCTFTILNRLRPALICVSHPNVLVLVRIRVRVRELLPRLIRVCPQSTANVFSQP